MQRSPLSALEYELELESEDPYGAELDEELDDDHETDESENELDDAEVDEPDPRETSQDYAELELVDSLSELDDSELDEEIEEPDVHGFAERFHELSLREFESELELDSEVNRLLGEMEQEYFFGGLGKLIKSAGKQLIKKGVAYVKSKVPIANVVKGVTALARGNLRGVLENVAKLGMGALSAHPAFAALMPAIQSLGFSGNGSTAGNQDAWANFVKLAKDSYGQLAQNLTPNADQPAEAARIAGKSYELALRRQTLGVRRDHRRPNGRKQRAQVVVLRPGQRLVVKVVG